MGWSSVLRRDRRQREDRRRDLKDLKTGKVIQYNAAPISDTVVQNKAQPVGIQGLRVGDAVDLVGGELHTASGATIPAAYSHRRQESATRKTMKRLLVCVMVRRCMAITPCCA